MNPRQRLALALAFPLALAGACLGVTGFTISGGLSNFDCTNHCDEPCDEFEIEIEGIHPEDVIHTYTNSNYGTPSVTLAASGTSTIIDYHTPGHLTQVNSIEHFGVSLRQLSASTPIRVRWMKNGRPATANGVVPDPTGGTGSPASQPRLPLITADMGTGVGGQDSVVCTVTNTDPSQAIWIKRRASVTINPVSLEALMPSNAAVTTSVVIDAAPVLLPAGASVDLNNDLVEFEDNQSVVFAAEYYQDLTGSGLFNQQGHTRGPLLGNVMTATLAGPGGNCTSQMPIINIPPASATANAGRSVRLSVDADGNDLPLSIQWLKEGQPIPANNTLGITGVTTDSLEIDALSAATEGFYSVKVSNTCGTLTSPSALVFITGHNIAPVHPPACIADFDQNGTRSIDDIFIYLNAWFADCTGQAGDPCNGASADVDNSGSRTIDDIFIFLNLWFAGCP